MTISIGGQVGPYQVKSPLGEGGMGVVFRALDTRLGRDVALKVVPDHFSTDPDRLARFQREAQILASLDHPNIAQIYGLEESGATRCIVMALVAGDTLADRLKRGAVPLEEALRIGRQICEALEAAHYRGIVHRDLKPANIKLTPAGKVKVLDFGLAKNNEERQGAGDFSNSPTMVSMAGTNAGVIFGTAAYMSPEQARGEPVDHRSDIFSFGCVMYELLTGTPAFGGKTVSDILASVIAREPDTSRFPESAPSRIRSLLLRCLAKDATQRWQAIGDVRYELEHADFSVESVAPSARTSRFGWVVAAAAAVGAAVLALPAVDHLREIPPRELRLEINVPSHDPSLAISPDGQKIVFVGLHEGRPHLLLRRMDSVAIRPLEQTEYATFPFWSPDSRSIGFFTEDRLKRIDIETGVVQTVTPAPTYSGGTWSRDDIILLGTASGPIFRVSAAGGTAEAVTGLQNEQATHRFPEFLPDGRRFLFYVRGGPEQRGVYAGTLDEGTFTRLLDADAAATYSAGHLLFVRQGTLFAQPFDAERLTLSGSPFPLAEKVQVSNRSTAPVSASIDGVVALRTGSLAAEHQLAWFDRTGKELSRVGTPDRSGAGFTPSLAPDGRHLALARTVDGNGDIWSLELSRGVLTRLTRDPAQDGAPRWSPDGARLAFSSTRNGAFDIYIRTMASGADELLLNNPHNKFVTDWSSDGEFLLFRDSDPTTGWDIWLLPLEGDRRPSPLVQTESTELDAFFSPDGNWIAYESNESGRFEIYIQPLASPGGRVQISTDGGTEPAWRSDGRELFYVSEDRRLMAVPIRLESDRAEAATPDALFPVPSVGAYSNDGWRRYTVAADGQRFLLFVPTEQSIVSPITILMNWFNKQ